MKYIISPSQAWELLTCPQTEGPAIRGQTSSIRYHMANYKKNVYLTASLTSQHKYPERDKGHMVKLYPHTTTHHHLPCLQTFTFFTRLPKIALEFFRFSTPTLFELYDEHRARYWGGACFMQLFLLHKPLSPSSNYL